MRLLVESSEDELDLVRVRDGPLRCAGAPCRVKGCKFVEVLLWVWGHLRGLATPASRDYLLFLLLALLALFCAVVLRSDYCIGLWLHHSRSRTGLALS